MWYAQLGFQSVIWTQLGTRVGLWVAYALLIAAGRIPVRVAGDLARPDAADGSTIRINGDTIEVGKGVELKECTSCGCGDFIDRRLDVRIAV